MNASATFTTPGFAATKVELSVCFAMQQFLGHEAKLLDEGRLDDWVALLDPDIRYEIPIRLAVKRGSGSEYPRNAFRMCDDLAMILKRIERTTTGVGWSEEPPSRTVRNVGSICVEATDDTEVFEVHSTVHVFRERATDEISDLIPARRVDRIRFTAGHCTLLARRVYLAETILRTPNLGIFL